jgi:endonuclease I
MFNCGGSDNDTPIDPHTLENLEPIAVDDTFNTTENTELLISDLLSNDTIVDNARITAFDTTSSQGGTIVDNRDGTYTYTPQTDFIGEDTFTYTICDRDDTPQCSTAIVTIIIADDGAPTAVDDIVNITENSTIIIDTLLINDDLIDDAVLSSVDGNNTDGTVVLNNNGTVTYTPQTDFVGEDSFTYTICDDDTTPECSTATVTIIIADAGAPKAVDDSVDTSKNSTIIISTLLENDDLIDDAVLSSVDGNNTDGTVVLNNNGTVTYTPQTDFIGEDSFTYTICDDDTTPECSTATVTITIYDSIVFNIPSELMEYYESALFINDADIMFEQLELLSINMHTTILSYGQRHQYLYNADADLSNSDNVILMYTSESRYWMEYTSSSNSYSTQTFNTEHVYPQSKLSSTGGVTDLHHLRSCDASINSQRSNYSFIDGSGVYRLTNSEWFPGDEWRGDVARMIMYLNIRYSETFDKVGTLNLFLEWNRLDPVSEFELQRNNVIEGAQGNRNPFIDNPYLATIIWGGTPAENKWE